MSADKHPSSKYDEDVMIRVILGCGKEGGSVEEMAHSISVSVCRLYVYAAKHKNFKEAFTRAKQRSIIYWFRLGEKNLNSQHFKERTFETLIRLKCQAAADRRLPIAELAEAKTHNDKAAVIEKRLADGDLSAQEAKTHTERIATAAKIDEVTELRAIVEKLEKANK